MAIASLPDDSYRQEDTPIPTRRHPYTVLRAVSVLVSRVMAAVRAIMLPCTVAPVVTVMEAWAMMLPKILVSAPRVAELPTCLKA